MPKKPKQPPPPLPPDLAEAWPHVIDIAMGIRELSPWECFAPDAVVGVRDPESGEMDWCTVMGHEGNVFGLAIHQGDTGYESLHRIQRGEFDEFDAQLAQQCTTLFFGSAADLMPRSKKLLKALGRTFRGANAWPELLVHEPGFVPMPPWHAAQLRRAANALCGLASLAPWASVDPHGGGCQVEGHAWATEAPFAAGNLQQVALPKVQARTAMPAPFDRLAAARLRNGQTRRVGQWFVEWFAGLGVIDGPEAEGRPYFAIHMMLIDLDSDMMVGMHIGRLETVAADLQALVLKSAAQFGLPARLHVRRADLAESLQPFAAELGVPLACEPKLAQVTDRVRSEMQQFLGG